MQCLFTSSPLSQTTLFVCFPSHSYGLRKKIFTLYDPKIDWFITIFFSTSMIDVHFQLRRLYILTYYAGSLKGHRAHRHVWSAVCLIKCEGRFENGLDTWFEFILLSSRNPFFQSTSTSQEILPSLITLFYVVLSRNYYVLRTSSVGCLHYTCLSDLILLSLLCTHTRSVVKLLCNLVLTTELKTWVER